jgi:hypothetical protein
MKAEIELAEDKETSLLQQGSALTAQAATFAVVKSDTHRDEAMVFGQQIKRMRGMVADLFDDPISLAHKTHKTLCSRKNILDDPLKSAEETAKRGIGTYEAAKRSEIERKRQEELAEQRRIAEEAERARQKIIAEQRRAEEEKRLAEAMALEAAGKKAAAEAVLSKPIIVPPPPPPPVAAPPIFTRPYVAPEGASTRTNWKFTIVNESLIPREFMTPDLTKIGAHVRTHKDKTNVPGIQPYPDLKAAF